MTYTRNGKKLYPVGSWQNYQHVFYNYDDRCYIAMVDSDYSDETVAAKEEAERLLDVCNANVRGGLIYAPWEDYKKMKDIIVAYELRH